MAVTYDLTTAIGKVRLKIADTDITDAHFTDEELQVFLDEAGGSDYLAAALALEAWATAISSNMTSEKIGDYSYTKKEAESKLAAAARYRTQEESAPVSTWAEMNLTGETTEDE